jgi:D-aminopeptidase
MPMFATAGVPLAFLSGDKVMCGEVQALRGGIVTVPRAHRLD